MGKRLLSLAGTVLDTNLICDLMRVDEWDWVRQEYGPLFITQPVWDGELDDEFRRQLLESVTVAVLTDKEWKTVLALRDEFGGAMSGADRGTVAVSIHRNLRCGSNDGAIHTACQSKGMETLRTLGVLITANHKRIKTKKECQRIVEWLRRESNMRITQDVIDDWTRRLQ